MIDKVSGQVLRRDGVRRLSWDGAPTATPSRGTMLKYDTSQDGYVVPLDKIQLEAAPRYGRGRSARGRRRIPDECGQVLRLLNRDVGPAPGSGRAPKCCASSWDDGEILISA